jgi:hypothetical protein
MRFMSVGFMVGQAVDAWSDAEVGIVGGAALVDPEHGLVADRTALALDIVPLHHLGTPYQVERYARGDVCH